MEQKYIVIRRDGTIPEWPSFVLGACDRASPSALLEYHNEGVRVGFGKEYLQGVAELAGRFHNHRMRHGSSAPEAAAHRTDCPLAIRLMHRQTDIAHLAGMMAEAAQVLADCERALSDGLRARAEKMAAELRALIAE